MEFFKWADGVISPWITYYVFCIDAVYTAPACRSFWNWIVIVSWGLAGVIVLWFLWKFIDYKLKYAAAIRAQLERERIAEHDIIESVRWVGNDPVLNGASDSDMAGEIRAALARRKDGLDKPASEAAPVG